MKYHPPEDRLQLAIYPSQKDFMRKVAKELKKKGVLKRNSITELVVLAVEQMADKYLPPKQKQ